MRVSSSSSWDHSLVPFLTLLIWYVCMPMWLSVWGLECQECVRGCHCWVGGVCCSVRPSHWFARLRYACCTFSFTACVFYQGLAGIASPRPFFLGCLPSLPREVDGARLMYVMLDTGDG